MCVLGSHAQGAWNLRSFQAQPFCLLSCYRPLVPPRLPLDHKRSGLGTEDDVQASGVVLAESGGATEDVAPESALSLPRDVHDGVPIRVGCVPHVVTHERTVKIIIA